ncbi:hypothetical protein, partial [Mesorhizobium sp. M8A.F.Ca.ET.213.01.1.1]|uniref:hypothetical protein n=1 Tax=Mesorhizobium sp. M8A.F.Ca.ET.213.01.1.1 TaxID=2563970 RepID=UPI001AEE30D0
AAQIIVVVLRNVAAKAVFRPEPFHVVFSGNRRTPQGCATPPASLAFPWKFARCFPAFEVWTSCERSISAITVDARTYVTSQD